MLKSIGSLILGIFFTFTFVLPVQAAPIEILVFHKPSCPHCQNIIAKLDEFKQTYSELDVKLYDVYNDSENRATYSQLGEMYDQLVDSVPIILINDKLLSGDSTGTINAIEQEINYCQTQSCQNPSDKIAAWQADNPDSEQNVKRTQVIYLLVGLGILCFFIVLIFLFKEKKHG